MKRSAQVGLVLMTAVGVGGTAYLLMPGQDCRPVAPQAGSLHAPTAPGQAAAAPQNCAPRGSSHSSGGYGFFSRSSSGTDATTPAQRTSTSTAFSHGSPQPSSVAPPSGAAGKTATGGFGSIGRAFSSMGG